MNTRGGEDAMAAAQEKRERRKKKAIAQVLRYGDGLWKISWVDAKPAPAKEKP